MTQAFGLIETLAFEPGGEIVLLEAHLARMAASARHFGFRYAAGEALAVLETLTRGQQARLRLRLVLGPDGELAGERHALPAPPPGLVWRVSLAPEGFSSQEPLLRHKTTLRQRYEAPLAASGHDEVIFCNERGELCEGARSNLFIARGGILLTPPLDSGLLPGTLRGQLLAEGRAREHRLTVADLATGRLFMGNSLRGLVPAQLVTAPLAGDPGVTG